MRLEAAVGPRGHGDVIPLDVGVGSSDQASREIIKLEAKVKEIVGGLEGGKQRTSAVAGQAFSELGTQRARGRTEAVERLRTERTTARKYCILEC